MVKGQIVGGVVMGPGYASTSEYNLMTAKL